MPKITVPDADILHLKNWWAGTHDRLKEPVLILELMDGRKLHVMMPAETAIDLGNSINEEGHNVAARVKPN